MVAFSKHERCQSVVPLRSLFSNLLEAAEAVKLRVQPHINHFHEYLLIITNGYSGSFYVVQVTLIALDWVIKLTLLYFDHLGTFSAHLVQLLKQLLTQVSLALIERLHSRLDLCYGVQLESLLIDWVDKLVDSVKEDSNILFNLLVTHEVLEVAIGVVTILLFLGVEQG